MVYKVSMLRRGWLRTTRAGRWLEVCLTSPIFLYRITHVAIVHKSVSINRWIEHYFPGVAVSLRRLAGA